MFGLRSEHTHCCLALAFGVKTENIVREEAFFCVMKSLGRRIEVPWKLVLELTQS